MPQPDRTDSKEGGGRIRPCICLLGAHPYSAHDHCTPLTRLGSYIKQVSLAAVSPERLMAVGGEISGRVFGAPA